MRSKLKHYLKDFKVSYFCFLLSLCFSSASHALVCVAPTNGTTTANCYYNPIPTLGGGCGPRNTTAATICASGIGYMGCGFVANCAPNCYTLDTQTCSYACNSGFTMVAGSCISTALSFSSGSFSVTGTGAGPPGSATLSINPVSQSFGDVRIGTAAPVPTPVAFTVTNTSAVLAPNCSTSITPSGEFSFTSTCSSSSNISAGSSCSITVLPTPTTTGSKNATLTVSCAGAGNPTVSAPLSENGIILPALSMGAAAPAYGTVVVGAPQTRTIQVNNAGTINATSCSITSSATQFSINPGSTCETSGVPAGGTCAFQLVATAPPGNAFYTSNITITCTTTSSPNYSNYNSSTTNSYSFNGVSCAVPGQYIATGGACVCPAGYEVPPQTPTPKGPNECRPIPPSLDFYRSMASDGFPVCGSSRIAVGLDYSALDLSSGGVPNSGATSNASNAVIAADGYVYKHAQGLPATPVYQYSMNPIILSRCVCSTKNTFAKPVGTGQLLAPTGTFPNSGGQRFLPIDFETIQSQTKAETVKYSEIAIATDEVSNGNIGDIFNTTGAVSCGCPNVNEIAVSNDPTMTSISGSACRSMMSADVVTQNFKILTTFNPAVHANQVFSTASEPVSTLSSNSGNIVTRIKLPTINGGVQDYQRRIWTCAPPSVAKVTAGVISCVFDADAVAANACNNGLGSHPASVVSSNITAANAAAKFDKAVNKKLACCLNDFDAADPTRTQKFDCIDNSATPYTSFDALWTGSDGSDDGGQPNAIALTGSSGQLMTGFYTLDGTRCNQYSEFAGNILAGAVNPVIVSAQQSTVGNGSATATEMSTATAVVPPTALKTKLTALGKSVPTAGGAAAMRLCPILVRAAIKTKCPEATFLPQVIATSTSGSVKRCASAASIEVHLKIEQLYEIKGTPKMKTIDSLLNPAEAANVDVSGMIKTKTQGLCPAGSILSSDGTCTYQ